mmetsp:Transcript_2803/g.4066  ORF Transcript_2803/g.4066 Transcript_2803/m.4066 type:complete len:225 (+) Transcript_2803:26-700(+)|eukprot:CAMPEP_0167763088 /NCGR_PEP_ID=MMETSP0110_2-20121227/13150_1 /TAXON_ID=629695 /ORGANISM="Gymnochlora sp., Strain CCMP2014" /LENGTH=224 /DNA_ID=CAMNT_0007650077 /DNA_START=27 /DNA_END=701 /DNA_ORIENTATION=-
MTSESIRENVIEKAVEFLRHPSVINQPQSKQLAFLFKKGLTPREATLAYQKVVREGLEQKKAKLKSEDKKTSSIKRKTDEKESNPQSGGILSSITNAIGTLLYEKEEKPAEVGELTPLELSQFNGVLHERLLVSVEKKIYDVTSRWDLYGPGKKYNVFTGNDVTYAFATMSTDKSSMNLFGKELSEEGTQILGEWKAKYEKNYVIVGTLVLPEDEQEKKEEETD